MRKKNIYRGIAAVIALATLTSIAGCGKSASDRINSAFEQCRGGDSGNGVALLQHMGVVGSLDIDSDPTDTTYSQCMFRELKTPQSVIDLMKEMPPSGHIYAAKDNGIYYLWEPSGVNRSDIMFSASVPSIIDDDEIIFKKQ